MAVPTDMDGFNDKIGTTDTYSKLSLGDALINYLGNHVNSIECTDIGQFIDKLVPWLTCSNFKVSFFFKLHKLLFTFPNIYKMYEKNEMCNIQTNS